MSNIQLYESVINKSLEDMLNKLDMYKAIHKDKLDPANSSVVLAALLTDCFRNRTSAF